MDSASEKYVHLHKFKTSFRSVAQKKILFYITKKDCFCKIFLKWQIIQQNVSV